VAVTVLNIEDHLRAPVSHRVGLPCVGRLMATGPPPTRTCHLVYLHGTIRLHAPPFRGPAFLIEATSGSFSVLNAIVISLTLLIVCSTVHRVNVMTD